MGKTTSLEGKGTWLICLQALSSMIGNQYDVRMILNTARNTLDARRLDIPLIPDATRATIAKEVVRYMEAFSVAEDAYRRSLGMSVEDGVAPVGTPLSPSYVHANPRR